MSQGHLTKWLKSLLGWMSYPMLKFLVLFSNRKLIYFLASNFFTTAGTRASFFPLAFFPFGILDGWRRQWFTALAAHNPLCFFASFPPSYDAMAPSLYQYTSVIINSLSSLFLNPLTLENPNPSQFNSTYLSPESEQLNVVGEKKIDVCRLSSHLVSNHESYMGPCHYLAVLLDFSHQFTLPFSETQFPTSFYIRIPAFLPFQLWLFLDSLRNRKATSLSKSYNLRALRHVLLQCMALLCSY